MEVNYKWKKPSGFSQYNDATLKDLRKVVPNIRQAIMWSYEVWSKLDA